MCWSTAGPYITTHCISPPWPLPGLPLPEAALTGAIDRCFGSMEDFLRALRHLSLSDQREGYTWLLSDRCGRLRLLFTPGQATALPLSPYSAWTCTATPTPSPMAMTEQPMWRRRCR